MSFHFFYQRFFHSLAGCLFISSRLPFHFLSTISYPPRFHFFSGVFFIAFWVPFHIYFIVSLLPFHCFPAPISLLIHHVFIPSRAPFSLLSRSHFISISLFLCCDFIASWLPFHRVFIPSRAPFSFFPRVPFHSIPGAFSLLPGSHFIAYPLHFHSFSGIFFITFWVLCSYFITYPLHFHSFPGTFFIAISLLIRRIFIPSPAPFSFFPQVPFHSFPGTFFIASQHFIAYPPHFHSFLGVFFIASRLLFHSLPATFSRNQLHIYQNIQILLCTCGRELNGSTKN